MMGWQRLEAPELPGPNLSTNEPDFVQIENCVDLVRPKREDATPLIGVFRWGPFP